MSIRFIFVQKRIMINDMMISLWIEDESRNEIRESIDVDKIHFVYVKFEKNNDIMMD